MPGKQELLTMPLESGCGANSPTPTLSRECKHQLAMLVANMIETHLSSQPAIDTRFDAEQFQSSSGD
jgi:hypothetical protein